MLYIKGLNLGIADAQELANVIIKGIETGEDIGNYGLLKEYGDKRYVLNPFFCHLNPCFAYFHHFSSQFLTIFDNKFLHYFLYYLIGT